MYFLMCVTVIYMKEMYRNAISFIVFIRPAIEEMGFMWKNRNADSLITREIGFLQEDKLNTLTIPLNSESKKNIICYNDM